MKSRGVATVEFPVYNIVLKCSMHIINSDLPNLLSLADMGRLGVYYNNLENKLYHVPSGFTSKCLRQKDRPFLWWYFINDC